MEEEKQVDWWRRLKNLMVWSLPIIRWKRIKNDALSFVVKLEIYLFAARIEIKQIRSC